MVSFKLLANFLYLNIKIGIKNIKGQALKKTTLQDPDNPIFSKVRNGNQYKPQAAELTMTARLK